MTDWLREQMKRFPIVSGTRFSARCFNRSTAFPKWSRFIFEQAWGYGGALKHEIIVIQGPKGVTGSEVHQLPRPDREIAKKISAMDEKEAQVEPVPKEL